MQFQDAEIDRIRKAFSLDAYVSPPLKPLHLWSYH